MTGQRLAFTRSEIEVRRIISAIVGKESLDAVGPVFALAQLCLREAARCLDDEDFLASCVMSRSAVEAAFYGSLYSQKVPMGPNMTKTGFLVLRPPVDPKSRVRQRFDALCAKVEGRAVLSGNIRRAIHRVKRDGDLSAHLAERYWESFWRTVTRSEAEQLTPPERRRPVRVKWSWPAESVASRRLRDTAKIVGALALAKLGEPARTVAKRNR